MDWSVRYRPTMLPGAVVPEAETTRANQLRLPSLEQKPHAIAVPQVEGGEMPGKRDGEAKSEGEQPHLLICEEEN